MSSTERKPRKDVLRNRELLIAAAAQVFAEHGIDAPYDLIAQQARVGSGTLYRHFRHRDDLVLETFRLVLRAHMGVIAEGIASASQWEGFKTWLTYCYEEQLNNVSLAQMLTGVPSSKDDEVDFLRQATLDGIETLLSGAQTERRMRVGVTLGDVLLYLEAHGAIIREGSERAKTASARWLTLTLEAFEAFEAFEAATEARTN